MSAIQSYQQYGVTRSQVHSLMINLYHYPDQYLDTLSEYFGYHYAGSYLHANLIDGTVSKKGYVFMTVFHKCTAQEAKNAAHIAISFRVPQKEFGLSPYAVVRIISKHRAIDDCSAQLNLPELTTGKE